MKILKLVLAAGIFSLVGCESIAPPITPPIRECGKDCVEFTVRYYASKQIELIDPESKMAIKQTCVIGKDCKPLPGNFVDLSTLTLMQGHNPHFCYRVCGVGWCADRCPSH